MYCVKIVFLLHIFGSFRLTNGIFFSDKYQRGDMGDPVPKKNKLKDNKNNYGKNTEFKENNEIVSPPPVGTGLYATVQNLQEQVLNLQQSYNKERSKIRRLERRVRECKDGVALTKSDIVQLKQNVREISTGYTDVQETIQDFQIQNSGLEYELKQNKKDFTHVSILATSNSESLLNLWNNITEINSESRPKSDDFAQMQSEIKNVSKKQNHLSKHVNKLQKDINNVLVTSTKNTKTTYTVKLTNGTKLSPNILDEIDLWGSGSGEIEKEFIILGEENENQHQNFGISGDGEIPEDLQKELPDLFSEYEDLVQNEKYLELKSNVTVLETNIQNLENKMQTLLSEDTFEKYASKFEELLQKERHKSKISTDDQDEAIAELEQQYNNMVAKINKLDEKVRSIQLGDFMKSLQESLINFTQNVITLEQWKTASTQMINSTQYNQKQIMELKGQVINITRIINHLNWATVDNRGKNDQQYRVLQMHVIHLNNSLQDLREHVTYIGTIQLPSRRQNTGERRSRYLPPSTDVLSRLEDLGLQITFNENRISNIENRVMNKSLYQCQKANTDIFQDSKLAQLDSELSQTQTSMSVIREMFKRLDRAIYRVHAYTQNSSKVIFKLQSKFISWDSYIPVIQLLRQEVKNLLYTLPIDCESYYKQGHTKNGLYVINPPKALQSFKIPCIMEDDSGWTVIQHRFNGKTKFSRGWSEYAVGFGSPAGEFWIGNEFLHLLTSNKNYSLQIEMVDIFDGYWLVDYDYFYVASKEKRYRLSVSGFSGNATDGMAYSNDMEFSTQDSDNDLSSTHCALYYTAGWWYRHCQYSNLNGRYNVGAVWFNKDLQDWIQLKSTTMKIRPQISDKAKSVL